MRRVQTLGFLRASENWAGGALTAVVVHFQDTLFAHGAVV
jgi:hypothetical protein